MVDHLREEIPDICAADNADLPVSRERPRRSMRSCMEFVDDDANLTGWAYLPIPRRRTRRRLSWTTRSQEEQKKLWRDELMELQQEISLDKAEEMIGRELLCMIEGKRCRRECLCGPYLQRCAKCGRLPVSADGGDTDDR